MGAATQSQPLAQENGAALCEARGVTHKYFLPSGKELCVLDGIDLKIFPDEVVALLGPSGCGKSTLLRILSGLIRPTSGEVLSHGMPFAGINPNVAIVFQSFALYPWMTVQENVEVVLRAARCPDAEIRAKAAAAVKSVGLEGFEEAYPRELSGGMKQRAGMARALALNPEILFMDEPFSHVDALTAEALRAEVIDLWSDLETNPSAIVLVSHDIREVAYMADRIALLGANPGRLRRIIRNPVPHPRDPRSPELDRFVETLHDLITGHEMPDEAPEVASSAAIFEPLPDASPIQIVGLIEQLSTLRGGSDLFALAQANNEEFGRFMEVVKAGELLDFVDTPKRRVQLTALGKKFAEADVEARKRLWSASLQELAIFKEILGVIRKSAGQEIDRDLGWDLIVMRLPNENSERTFDTLVAWGRYGDLLAYDDNQQRLWLQH